MLERRSNELNISPDIPLAPCLFSVSPSAIPFKFVYIRAKIKIDQFGWDVFLLISSRKIKQNI